MTPAPDDTTPSSLERARVPDYHAADVEPGEEAAARRVASKANLRFIDLRKEDFQPQVIKLITEAQARRLQALVLADCKETYLVGFVDPWDLRAQDEVANLLKRPIDAVVIMPSQMNEMIERVYRKTEQIGRFVKEVGEEVVSSEPVIDLNELGGDMDEAEAPVVKLLQTIFDDAARVNASDIHFEPQQKSLVVRFRIDGILHIQVEADPRIAPTLVVRLKLLAGLDIAERRLPQDGRFNAKSGESQFDVRMSTMPTQFGESVVLRLLRQESGRLKLSQIMAPRERRAFEKAIKAPHGMILVVGPTGCGKSTTLYAALDELNSPDAKILTCEDPVEYRLPGLNQVQVNEKIGLTFARVLRSFLRQDPDILLVGEIRDQETADIAARAALTGHIVLSTLHTNDAASTPLRLIDMGVPGYLIAASLLAVLSQRLVRLNCTHCAAPYTPSHDELEWARHRLTEQEMSLAKFRMGRGCVRCNGSGYLGRRAVFEYLEMDEELATALQDGNTVEFQKKAKSRIGVYTMVRSTLEMVLLGETTIDEAIYVAAGGET